MILQPQLALGSVGHSSQAGIPGLGLGSVQLALGKYLYLCPRVGVLWGLAYGSQSCGLSGAALSSVGVCPPWRLITSSSVISDAFLVAPHSLHWTCLPTLRLAVLAWRSFCLPSRCGPKASAFLACQVSLGTCLRPRCLLCMGCHCHQPDGKGGLGPLRLTKWGTVTNVTGRGVSPAPKTVGREEHGISAFNLFSLTLRP